MKGGKRFFNVIKKLEAHWPTGGILELIINKKKH